MARYGPTTKDSSSVMLGLGKVLLGASATNIASTSRALAWSTDTLGVLESSNLISEVESWRLESGFPLMEDKTIVLRENARLECEFKEVKPKTIAFAKGIDASSGYDSVTSGEVALGDMSAPAYVRMEAIYTYPDQNHHMIVIFPRANVESNLEINPAKESEANVPMTIRATRADSEATGGDAAWDDMPLGRIYWTTADPTSP